MEKIHLGLILYLDLSYRFKIVITLRNNIFEIQPTFFEFLNIGMVFRDCKAWSIAKPMPKWVCDYCSLGKFSFALNLIYINLY